MQASDEHVPIPEPHDIDTAAEGLMALVMDDLPELCWDNISCARVLMQLATRCEEMADKLLEVGPKPIVEVK